MRVTKIAAVYLPRFCFISIFQVRKLRLREVIWLVQSHTDGG